MKRFTNWLATVGWLVLLSVASFAQSTIDGSLNPSLIPDITAQRMVLVNISNSGYTGGLQDMGMSDAGVAEVLNDANNFNTQYQIDIAQFNASVNPDINVFGSQRDTLVASTIAQIQSNLTGNDNSVFSAYIQGAKSSIVMSANSDGSPNNNGYSGSYTPQFQGGSGNPVEPIVVWGVDGLEVLDLDGGDGGSCVTENTQIQTLTAGNTWQSFNANLSGITSLTSGFDGTMMAFASGSLYQYSLPSNTWVQLPTTGGITQVSPVSSLSMYGVGNGTAYKYDFVNSVWNAISGHAVTIVAAGQGADTTGFFAANGAQTVYYNSQSHTWQYANNLPHTVVSMSAPNATTAYAVDSTGVVYHTGSPSTAFTVYTPSGLSGTPVRVYATQDGYVYIATSDGNFWQRKPGLGPQFVSIGNAGVFAASSGNDIYAVIGGTLKRYLSNSSATYTTYGGYYSGQTYQGLSNFVGTPEPTSGEDKVTLHCAGQEPQVLFDVRWINYLESAFTRVQKVSLISEWQGAPPLSLWYGSWNVGMWCTANTVYPDYNPSIIDEDLLNPTPWGWDTFAVCESSTGHQPWICSHGGAYKLLSSQPRKNCTYHP